MGNLAIFSSIFQILLAQQNYQTIKFFTESCNNEILNGFTRIAGDALIPIINLVVGERNTRNFQEDPILNIVIPGNLSNGQTIETVKENIFANDVTLIISHHNDKDEDIELWMDLSVKVIFLTDNLTIFTNTFRNRLSAKINLFPFDPVSAQNLIATVFSEEFYSGPLQRRNFEIFFQHLPPSSTALTYGEQFLMNGPDGSLAQALVKWLKIKPTFCTDYETSFPNYREWKDDPVSNKRFYTYGFYPNVLTTNFLTIFNKTVSDDVDLHLSPSVFGESRKFQTESLYPHDKACVVVVVPKQLHMDNFLAKILKEPEIYSICLVVIFFVIARIILQKSSWPQWIEIFIKTVGIFLSQATLINVTSIQKAWDMNLRGFSVFATITLSVIIYKNLMSEEYVEIDTVDQLIASNLTIIASQSYQNDETFWANIRPELRDKIHFKVINSIYNDTLALRKFNFAYVISGGEAEYLDTVLYAFISDSQSHNKQVIHTMSEKLYCIHTSYRISRTSPLKTYVNNFVLRFIENGLYVKHLQWTRQFNQAQYEVSKYKVTSADHKDPIVVDLNLIFGIFVLYMIGVAISVVAFIIELIIQIVFTRGE